MATAYICGGMTGLPDYNYPAFNAAAERWRKAGWEVKNPAEHFGGRTDLSYESYMREAVKALVVCDAIALLPGWETSRGARMELLLAQRMGFRVYSADSMGPMAVRVVDTSLTAVPYTAPKDLGSNAGGQPAAPCAPSVVPPFGQSVIRALEEIAKPAAAEPLKENVLEEANRLIYGDRNRSYGHPFDNFDHTAGLINAQFRNKLKEDFTAEEVGELMVLVKLSRQRYAHKRDNLTDIAGYVGCIDRIIARRAGGE